jgi:hypothetical protein
MLFLVPAILYALTYQVGWSTPDLRSPQFLAEEVRSELAKATYVARRDLPASETIFVEYGGVREDLLVWEDSTPAIRAGKRGTVEKVVVTERSIQVLFREKCGIIILPYDVGDLRDKNVPELVDLARAGLNTVFQLWEVRKPKLPT